MFYYIEKDNEIKAFEQSKETLEKGLKFMPQYQNLEILETEKEIVNFEGKLYFKEEIQEELDKEERERIGNLKLTRGDVFRALYLAKQVTRDDIRALIQNNELISEAQRELALIDFDEALNFYRGNTLIDTLGLALGITSEQLDEFFETNDYTILLSKDEV